MGPTEMTRKRSDLESSLAMAEIQVACLLVDYRDRPDVRDKLCEQRDALVALRRRESRSDSVADIGKKWSARVLGGWFGRMATALGRETGPRVTQPRPLV